MAFDIEMIKKLYAEMPAKVDAARKTLGRPLTLSEKILFAHLHPDQKVAGFERGKTFTIIANDASRENMYIQSAVLNGKKLDSFMFPAKELLRGGELILQMGPSSSKWGIKPE